MERSMVPSIAALLMTMLNSQPKWVQVWTNELFTSPHFPSPNLTSEQKKKFVLNLLLRYTTITHILFTQSHTPCGHYSFFFFSFSLGCVSWKTNEIIFTHTHTHTLFSPTIFSTKNRKKMTKVVDEFALVSRGLEKIGGIALPFWQHYTHTHTHPTHPPTWITLTINNNNIFTI